MLQPILSVLGYKLVLAHKERIENKGVILPAICTFYQSLARLEFQVVDFALGYNKLVVLWGRKF